MAFARRLPGHLWRIFVLTPKTGPIQEIYPTGPNQIDPSWFPDGKRIAFAGIPTIDEAEPGARQLRVVDLETGGLTSFDWSGGAYEPVISPDGNWMAALEAHSQHLLFYNFRTQQWKQCPVGPMFYPVWSSDSKSVYCGMKSSRQTSIGEVRLSDLRVRQAFDVAKVGAPSIYGRWLDWYPGGSLIMFRDLSINEFYMFDWK